MPIPKLKICLLLLGPLAAAAQATPAPPPRQANVAVVQTADSVRIAYHQLGQVLVAAGYDLDRANYDTQKLHGTLAYITTIDRDLPGYPAARVMLRASLLAAGSGTTVELRGTYTLDGLHRLPIANRGGQGSPAAAAWMELRRVAALFPNATATYRRER